MLFDTFLIWYIKRCCWFLKLYFIVTLFSIRIRLKYRTWVFKNAHILVTIQEEDKCHSADDLDDVICAEIPPGQSPECEPQENKQRELLRSIILENNIHHCNYQCKCDRVSDWVCTKGYPKDFLENSYLDEEEYYALYRRRKNGGQTFLYKKSG